MFELTGPDPRALGGAKHGLSAARGGRSSTAGSTTARPNLEFQVGDALDLSAFEDGAFGAVVAFEIVEHVQDQERGLDTLLGLGLGSGG